MSTSTWAALDGISHHYGHQVALRDITVGIGPGITALVGVNGAGKSTLLRVMATALRPAEGTFQLASVGDPWSGHRLGQVRRRIALMPQSFVPPSGVRTRDFVHYMAWLRGVHRRDRAACVGSTLERVGLSERAGERLATLSGGMLRRVLLAQALVSDPELLMLDEPTAGLDPEQRIRIRDLVAEHGQHRAIVVSSHQMEDLVPIAERVIMLDEGRVVFDGSTGELRALGAGAVGPSTELSVYEAAFMLLRSRRASQ